MKNIFKSLIPCLVLAVGFTSCYDEMEDKASVDAKYALANVPTVTLSATNVIDYSSASVVASLSSVEGVVEAGFMVAASADFSGAKIYTASAVASSIEQALAGLAEQTTYNVKAYAYLGDGRMVYSDASSFTTPQAPPLSTEMLSGKTYILLLLPARQPTSPRVCALFAIVSALLRNSLPPSSPIESRSIPTIRYT